MTTVTTPGAKELVRHEEPAPLWQLRPRPENESGDVALTLSLDDAGPVVAAGVDLVDVRRLGLALTRTGPALERRICTAPERAVLDDAGGDGPRSSTRRIDALAAAFGLKESALKALGGIAPGARFTDIDTHDCLREPLLAAVPLRLSGHTAAQARAAAVSLIGGVDAMTPELFVTWVVAVPIERSTS